MKKITKALFLASLIAMPVTVSQAAPTENNDPIILNQQQHTFTLDGKLYRPSGYTASFSPIYPDYDGVINNESFGGRKDIIYKRGKDPNTVLVDEETFLGIYVNDDYPKDKIPEEVYRATYEVVKIDKSKNEIRFKTVEAGNDFVKENFANSIYITALSNLNNTDVKTGDQIKLCHMFPTNGNEEMYIPEVYKSEITKKAQVTNMNSTEVLANKLFDNLVESEAAAILVENIHSLDIASRESLKESIKESDKVIKRGYKALLTEEERKADGNSKAIIKIIQIKYGKKLQTEKDQKLALSIYENMIMANAGRKLLIDYPNISKSIEKTLRPSVEESEQLVNRALKTLK